MRREIEVYNSTQHSFFFGINLLIWIDDSSHKSSARTRTINNNAISTKNYEKSRDRRLPWVMQLKEKTFFPSFAARLTLPREAKVANSQWNLNVNNCHTETRRRVLNWKKKTFHNRLTSPTSESESKTSTRWKESVPNRRLKHYCVCLCAASTQPRMALCRRLTFSPLRSRTRRCSAALLRWWWRWLTLIIYYQFNAPFADDNGKS